MAPFLILAVWILILSYNLLWSQFLFLQLDEKEYYEVRWYVVVGNIIDVQLTNILPECCSLSCVIIFHSIKYSVKIIYRTSTVSHTTLLGKLVIRTQRSPPSSCAPWSVMLYIDCVGFSFSKFLSLQVMKKLQQNINSFYLIPYHWTSKQCQHQLFLLGRRPYNK